MNLKLLTSIFAVVCLTDLTTSLKCRSCEGMQCDFEDDWTVESCSDQREQECYTLTRPEGDGKTYRMGCTHHSCRHLRDGREVKCTKCDRKNYCNEESAIGVGVRSTGGGSNRGSSGGGGSEGRGLDGNEFGSGGGSNRNGGTGGGGSQRQTGGGSDGFGQGSGGSDSDGFGQGSGGGGSNGFGQGSGGSGSDGRGRQQPVPNENMGGGVGGGSNQFGGTGGGGSGNGGGNGMSSVQWSHQRDHGQYQTVGDTEDVYQQAHSGAIGSRFCYTCRGEQCRNKANMNRQLCKEDKYETCYAVHDARNGTTHEMGCTHYTCTLLKAYVDSNVCEKCTGDFCNHKMWKYREMSGGNNGMDDDYFF